MAKRLSNSLIAVGACTCLVSTQAISQPQPAYLFQIHGSNTIGAELGPQLAKSYLISRGCSNTSILPNPELEETIISCKDNNKPWAIKIAALGSGTGFKAMNEGKAHIVASSRKIKPKEIKLLAPLGDIRSLGSENVIALDALAIIVNKNNPVESLSMGQISRIFKGLDGNWSRVGAKKLDIRLMVRDSRSGTRDTFNKLVLGKGGSVYSRHSQFTSNRALAKKVASDEKSIGFTSFSTLGKTKALAISMGEGESIQPSRINISTEDYPLTRKLYLYMPEGIENDEARAFLTFSGTQQGQQVVEDTGFIPLTIERTPQAAKPLSNRYARAVRGYERLNVNIRFTESNRTVDNFGLQNIKRLTDYMNNNNGSLLLVGFYGLSEGKKARQFSAEKAAQVSELLVRAGISRTRILIRGMGDDQLLSTGRGHRDNMHNIRVEAWFKPWFSGE